MRRLLLLAAFGLAACDRTAPTAENTTAGAGTALEAAAAATGLIADPAHINPVGAWARDTDRLCAVAATGDRYMIGALVDNGPGQSCAASGTAVRAPGQLKITFGDCHIDAALRGDQIIFPPTVADSCDRYCAGRGSFAAMRVDHLSESQSEATTLRGPDRKPLCAA